MILMTKTASVHCVLISANIRLLLMATATNVITDVHIL